MSFHAFNMGVNVLGYQKNQHLFGMTFAWGTMVDYDRVMILIGGQSDTGNNVEKGDIIGISGLNDKQKDIGVSLGENHSLHEEKYLNIKYHLDGNAILIDEAKTQIVLQVIDVFHLKESPNDNLIHAKILHYKENKNLKFLNLESVE